jgi:hypothetical protein
MGGPSITSSRLSPRPGKLDRRKRFKRLDGACRSVVMTGMPLEAGRFDAIDDEILVSIMHILVELPTQPGPGLEVHEAVVRGARDLRSLLMTCSRMSSALSTTGFALHREMAARAATQIAPSLALLGTTPYPFTEQVRDETRSAHQLRNLREAVDGLAMHCAGPCCQGSRNEFNRREQRLWTVAARSMLVAPSADGDSAFLCSRQRRASLVKPRLHNQLGEHAGHPSHPGHAEFIVHVAIDKGVVVQHSRLPLEDLDRFSAPQSMSASRCGRLVMIRAVHASHADESIPHSVAMVVTTRGGMPTLSGAISPPGEAEAVGAINAQAAWWLNDDGSRLVLLWSTAYIHPMGSVVGANADHACYFIAIYGLDYELHEYTGPFAGKAQTASPTASGKEVAILVRKAPVGNAPHGSGARCTMFHDVESEVATEIAHNSAIAAGRGPVPAHPLDLANCPSAAALSPSGDCLVAVHRRALTVLVEVLIRTAPRVFVSVQSIDVTHWTSLGLGEPSIFDDDSQAAVVHALKLPYSVNFSPCGRFAALVDQRPLYGLTLTNHALVVLDMAFRNERRGVRACALAPVEGMAPRTVAWSRRGFWVQARFGCLFLR